jgi:uncharacterized protein (DUF2267 family)
MSAQHLEALESTVQKTHLWIDTVAEAAHMDTHTAYQALRAVLQTLRDRLPAEEAAHLGAQLPMLVRGFYYEGWRPSEAPQRLDRESFLERVGERIVSSRILDPEAVVQTVLTVVGRFLSAGELEKIGRILPADLRDLLPDFARPEV